MKKFIAIIMVVAMMASFASVAFAADDVTLPGEGLVANYSFDKADENLSVVGAADGVTYTDGKAVFNGTAGLVSNVDLGKFEAMTVVITFEIKEDIAKSCWAFVIDDEESTSWDGRSFLGFNMSGTDFKSYASPKENVWCGGNWTGYEGDEAAAMVKAGQTHTMVIILGKAENAMQMDKGTEKGEATGLFHTLYMGGDLIHNWVLDGGKTEMSSFFAGDHARLFIGMSNITHDYKYDEIASGIAIDNLAVYNRALTDAEAKAASVGAPTTHTAPTVTVGKLGALPALTPPAETGSDTPTTGGTGTGTGGQGGNAPQTGFATVAIAIVAISSGAYIVSKKRH